MRLRLFGCGPAVTLKSSTSLCDTSLPPIAWAMDHFRAQIGHSDDMLARMVGSGTVSDERLHAAQKAMTTALKMHLRQMRSDDLASNSTELTELISMSQLPNEMQDDLLSFVRKNLELEQGLAPKTQQKAKKSNMYSQCLCSPPRPLCVRECA